MDFDISFCSNLVVTVSILVTEIINAKQKSKKGNYKLCLPNDYPKNCHVDFGDLG